MLKLSTRRIVVIVSSVLLVLMVILTSYVNYKGVKEKTNSSLTSSRFNIDKSPETFKGEPGVIVFASATNFNTQSMKLDLNLGYFLDSDAFPNVTSFSSKVGSKVTTYSIRDIVPQSDASFTITNAHPNNYPFDSYTTNVTISAMDSTTKKPLHIAFGFFGGLTGWGIALEVFDIGDNILMTIQLTRSNTTILFSLFIMLIMWALSITVVSLAFSVWFRDRTVEPPTIAFTGALLFALPAIRNIQPGAPQIGCIADTSSFFWCMMLVALSMLMNMWNYIQKHPRGS